MHDQSRYGDPVINPLRAISRPRIRLTISVKVGGLALMLLAGLVAVAGVSFFQMREIGKDINLVAKVDLTMGNHVSSVQRLSFDREKLRDSLVVYFGQNRTGKIEEAALDSRVISETIENEFGEIKSLITGVGDTEVISRYADLVRLLVELEILNNMVIQETEVYAGYLVADQRLPAANSVADLTDLMDDMEIAMVAVADEVGTLTIESAANAQARQRRSLTQVTIVTIGALFLGAVLSLVLVRQLTNSVRAVSIRARSIENTVGTDNFVHHEIPVSSSDEVADLATAFNEMSSSLERNIEERRRYETELANARDEAMQANQAKSKFLATISHELRTPLNAIIGYSEMLEEEAEELEQNDLVPDLQRINIAGRHLLTLINDVLDLSKIEAGQMDVFVEDFDLTVEMDEIVSLVTPLMDPNSNDFVKQIPENLGIMRADSTKVRQSLINLIGNAAKFTNSGTVMLAAARYDSDGEDWVRFDVTDTGIGMTEEQLGRVFEEFTQADSSISRQFEGTGLGLTLSRRFCQVMGGDITVESAYGKGSTFTILMPLNTEKYVPAEMLSSR